MKLNQSVPFTIEFIQTQDSALQILEIGLKYHLPELVRVAEVFIERGLTFDTVFPLLIEADRLSAEYIRQRALDFILNHWIVLARYQFALIFLIFIADLLISNPFLQPCCWN